jgi:ABC-type sugar transport system permease subunit
VATRVATLVRPAQASRTLRRDEMLWAYVFLLPWLIGLTVFIVGPILFPST